jgi:predicted acylesterase/phospholipase RssA
MDRDHSIENVLVLQGCGSLGAFGCGVFKALAESSVKIDILAGTSIGGVNAAIIAGSKNKWPEVLHKARDIMFSDKTAHNIKMSKVITRHLEFIKELYKIVENNVVLVR